jgi:hypothetical protein
MRQWTAYMARPTHFDPRRPFAPHLVVRVSPIDAQPLPAGLLSQGGNRCTVVVGSQAFTARTSVPLLRMLDDMGRRRSQEISLELLRPDVALPQLLPGTRFQLLAGDVAIAQGTVERVADAG